MVRSRHNRLPSVVFWVKGLVSEPSPLPDQRQLVSKVDLRERMVFKMVDREIQYCRQQLRRGYAQTYEQIHPDYGEVLGDVATTVLTAIAASDAAYHDVEHTILVTLTGQEILRGKQQQDGGVTPEDWFHGLLALLCHDVGYLKGICQGDRPQYHLYTTGVGSRMVTLTPDQTDASLTPYHVDRGQRFVAEQFRDHPLIDVKRVQDGIELTRFPVPSGTRYDDTRGYPGLIRAADLLGQLADPRYLDKLPALFQEFAENGTNQQLGYQHPGDLRDGVPGFFWTVVAPYIQDGLKYLCATQGGKQVVANLYGNIFLVEHELHSKAMQQQAEHLSGMRSPSTALPA